MSFKEAALVYRIGSRSNPKVKALVKKRDRCFFFEGEKLVNDILKRDIEISILVVNEKKENQLILPGKTTVKETWYVSDTILEKISSLKEKPGFIAVLELQEKTINFRAAKVVIALDNLQDPANAGTVFRCAAAFGIDAIALTGASVKLNNSKFLRAAQNAVFDLNYQRFPDVGSLIKNANEANFNIYLTSSHSSKDTLAPRQIKQPCLILFGNEGKGLDKELFDCCSSIRIPQADTMESLNVGVAACIIMHEIMK